MEGEDLCCVLIRPFSACRSATSVDSEWMPQFPLNRLLTVCIPPGASENGHLLLLTLFPEASMAFGFLVLRGTEPLCLKTLLYNPPTADISQTKIPVTGFVSLHSALKLLPYL